MIYINKYGINLFDLKKFFFIYNLIIHIKVSTKRKKKLLVFKRGNKKKIKYQL